MITERIVLEILEHEAIVPEAYKDSKGVWTWGVGVTDRSGHSVGRYKDKPTSIKRCLEVYEWLLREKYLPGVLRAFKGRKLAEHQLGAALSFHYNSGAIAQASWVQSWLAGHGDKAYDEFMNWSRPREIIGRRKCERELFFNGTWTSDGKVLVYQRVRRPSYSPEWGSSKLVDIRPQLRELLQA